MRREAVWSPVHAPATDSKDYHVYLAWRNYCDYDNIRPMIATTRLAESIFRLSKLSWRDVAKQTAELTESAFLALDHLAETEVASVGEITKQIKVLPAQMSRILRSLESKGLVACDINPGDKRKVDVTITKTGKRVHSSYRKAKLIPIINALDRLSEAERSQFMALVQKMTKRE